jgi:hypothetical protein
MNEDVLRRLVATGHEIDLDDYAAYEYDPSRGGWKALNFLIDRGFCTGVGDYFRNLTAHLPVEWPAFPHPAEAITRFCLDWCVRRDLLITGGSDCHGGLVGRELGVPLVDTADLRLGELEERIVRST